MLYKKELKEPQWREIPKSQGAERFKAASTFNRIYQPNGALVETKTFDEQAGTIKKFFIDDWNRSGFGYDTCFEGEQYHLVKKKNEPGLEVVLNERGIKEFTTDGVPCKPFKGYSKRPDQYLSLNDSRFEPI